MPLRMKFAVNIERSIEDAFRAFTDVCMFPEWVSIVLEVRDISELPIRVGTTFQQYSRILGKSVHTDSVVTIYEPLRRFVYTGSGDIPILMDFTFEPIPNGTRIVMYSEAHFGRFLGIPRALLKKGVARQVKADLRTFKNLLETRAWPSISPQVTNLQEAPSDV